MEMRKNIISEFNISSVMPSVLLQKILLVVVSFVIYILFL